MVHKPIAIMMILLFFVAGILTLGILSAATARGADDNAGGGETQAPPAGGGETAPAAPPPATEAPPAAAPPPATEAPPAAAPPPATEAPPAAAPPAGAPQVSNNTANATDFINTILAIHNRERALVGVPPLVWSESLAAGAQTWADHLVAISTNVHSTTQGYGENIAWRSHGVDALPLLVESWVAEKNGYNVAPFQWDRDVTHAHYTAMVWRTTTEIGCGIANGSHGTSTNIDYLVCRYTPGGNVNGQPPY
jgi:cysteine-rich secretory family protein